ncbi:MAG: hypothetical protein C5B60_02225 [Chloroflexi bacterium]|nr:MAG: hypothetical protein C5B60_02225 [Chloroflexota bacterium]
MEDSGQANSQRLIPEDYGTWNAYWTVQGMPWRTEPEINADRQRFLAERRAVKPDIARRIFPFRDENGSIKLTRADVEWLLATHESCGLRGPVNVDDPGQWNREGLDVRGADVSDADLHGLPLARLRGGIAGGEYQAAMEKQRQTAALCGPRVKLYSAHLEGSILTGAQLEGADFYEAHLEGADLFEARLVGADLQKAFFDTSSTLNRIILVNSEDGVAPLLRDVHWDGVNLSGIRWSYVGVLGEECDAQQRLTPEGKPKDAATRRVEYLRAVRSNRQLAATLRSQGLTDDADRFAYRAQVCQQQVLRYLGIQALPAYVGSLLLWALAGYGYRLWRILAAYGLVLAVFTLIYAALGVHSYRGESGVQALWDSFLVSLSAVHGRATFEQLGAWSVAAWAAAVQSVAGIVIEGVFVAMLVQRFFGSR